jgi:hypothetical protein
MALTDETRTFTKRYIRTIYTAEFFDSMTGKTQKYRNKSRKMDSNLEQA